MTVFAGHYGSVEFKRIGSLDAINCFIHAADLDVARERISLSLDNGIDLPLGTITSGDRVKIATQDARGLPFRWYENAENTIYEDDSSSPLEFFAHVNSMGAIRMYRNYPDAITNPGMRFLAIPLAKSEGASRWPVTLNLLPGVFNSLGRVQGFQITTDRESVDTTALGNKYKQFNASAISGSGSVDCLFDLSAAASEEIPLALSQLIQKIEVGSKFAGKFYLLEPGDPQPPGYTFSKGVYYEVDGMLTSSAMTVRADQIVECSFDFITSGEFALKVGDLPVELTTENNVRIGEESTLEQLGVLEETD